MDNQTTYKDAYASYERDLMEAQALGSLENQNGIWNFSIMSVRTPPGKVKVRMYEVDTMNFTIKVEVHAGAPESYREAYTLDLMKNEVLEYQRSEATKVALQPL